MKAPSICIITPVYNGLPYIKECIDSVLSQEYEDWEMIITDNCSTDGTVEYLKTILDTRIKIFYQEKNLGIFGNLNFAFTKATAPISQILCADDYFMTNKSLESIVRYWDNINEKIGVVRFNQEIVVQKEAPKNGLPTVIKSEFSSLYFFLLGNFPGNLSNVSLRTCLVKETGFFNQKFPYAGDFDFWYRASKNVDIAIENEVVIYVRRHEGVASNYLNLNGELLGQKVSILNQLFADLTLIDPKSRFLLKLHGTLCFDSTERSNAYVNYYKGNKFYLKELNLVQTNAVFCFKNEFIRHLIFIISMGGRLGRSFTSKLIFGLLKII